MKRQFSFIVTLLFAFALHAQTYQQVNDICYTTIRKTVLSWFGSTAVDWKQVIRKYLKD